MTSTPDNAMTDTDHNTNTEHPSSEQAGGASPFSDGVRYTSWAMLLSQWTSFAKASVAFPQTIEGDAWRASIAPAIGLQAITCSLADLDRLEPDLHSVALDTAGVGIAAHTREIEEAWPEASMPETLAELIGDARIALRSARESHGVQTDSGTG